MINIDPLFPPKAAAIVRELLPGETGGSVMAVTAADWARIRSTVGTPVALDEALAPLDLMPEATLPPYPASVLVNTVTLYARAVEFFDTEAQARQWWQTPLRLYRNSPARSPKDWAGVPGAEAELAARIRRTQHGIF